MTIAVIPRKVFRHEPFFAFRTPFLTINNFIPSMKLSMSPCRTNKQILNSVIGLISVNMMNVLGCKKFFPKMFFKQIPMSHSAFTIYIYLQIAIGSFSEVKFFRRFYRIPIMQSSVMIMGVTQMFCMLWLPTTRNSAYNHTESKVKFGTSLTYIIF